MAAYLGDHAEDGTLHFLWSTTDKDGASITRAVNGQVRVYKDNGVGQSTAGITDTEDFDGLTGIHACTIDLSSDAFYAIGADYTVVLQGATIDGEVVNAVLAHFSIENRFTEVALSATGKTDVNAEVDSALDTVIPGSPTAGSVNDHVKDLGNLIQDKGTVDDTTPAADDFKGSSGFNNNFINFYSQMLVVFTSGVLAGQARLVFSYAESTRRFGFINGFSTAPADGDSFLVLSVRDFGAADVADAVWNEQRSGHTGGGTFGEGVTSNQGDVKGTLTRYTMRTATCQAGSTPSTIKLDAGASGTDDQYKGLQIWIYAGTGAIQSRMITGYVAATKVATISPDWITEIPDATSKFVISPAPNALSLADELLKRPISSVEPIGNVRSLYGAIAALVNRVRILAGNLEVMETDDVTIAQSKVITEDAGQDPISELDP